MPRCEATTRQPRGNHEPITSLMSKALERPRGRHGEATWPAWRGGQGLDGHGHGLGEAAAARTSSESSSTTTGSPLPKIGMKDPAKVWLSSKRLGNSLRKRSACSTSECETRRHGCHHNGGRRFAKRHGRRGAARRREAWRNPSEGGVCGQAPEAARMRWRRRLQRLLALRPPRRCVVVSSIRRQGILDGEFPQTFLGICYGEGDCA